MNVETQCTSQLNLRLITTVEDVSTILLCNQHVIGRLGMFCPDSNHSSTTRIIQTITRNPEECLTFQDTTLLCYVQRNTDKLYQYMDDVTSYQRSHAKNIIGKKYMVTVSQWKM